ncbi:MAG: ArsR/SmtB family transcription factor [Hyphomicrobiales bacterium]
MEHSQAVTALSALAQEHRLAVFRLLVSEGPGGLAAGEIATRLGLSPAALSFHLKELDRAGLVISARDGRFIRYAISVEGMRRLLTFLTRDCCGGDPGLCGAAIASAAAVCGAGACGE